jgi:5'-AMP-activated protein kinase catalytic alpha subunit
MLCGYLPFEDPNTNKLYKKIIAGDFEMPKILSAEARDILRNILNVNPETRYKLSQIRASKWYNLCKTKNELKGIIIGKDQITPDDNIIKRMEKHDFDPVQIRTYVMNNRHNHITAAYYLFQKKIEKEPKVQP